MAKRPLVECPKQSPSATYSVTKSRQDGCPYCCKLHKIAVTESMLDKYGLSMAYSLPTEAWRSLPPKESTYPTSQEFTDSKGVKSIVYTSGYARFSQDLLPKGLGSVTAILSAYNGKWRTIIRDRKDTLAPSTLA